MIPFAKKPGLLLLFLMLISCTPTVLPTATPTSTVRLTTAVPTAYPTLSLAERFRRVLGVDVHCSHLCFQGINPGVTSAVEARTILGTTSQSDTYLTYWNERAVVTTFENGLVKSINFSSQSNELNFEMVDFLQLFGDPAEIRIEVFPGIECPIGKYFVYYPSQKLVLYVAFFAYGEGPSPMDFPSEMTLNTEFDDNTFVGLWGQPLYEPEKYPFKRQPWLGFGHIHDYLPGRSLPTGPCQH